MSAALQIVIFPLDSLGEQRYIPNQFRGTNNLTDQAQLLPGTLDLLILRAVSLGPLHGYGILLRIGQISDNALLIEQGALYPGLFRLVRQGLLKASWGTSENNRRAKFYALTAAGRKRLREETVSWNRLATAIASALAPQPEEV
jgi:PadR family transcriptional regulator, regulatory protein PadR